MQEVAHPGPVLLSSPRGFVASTTARSLWGELSADFRPLVLPEGDLAVVAAGGQQPRLLGVPGHAVDVLRVCAGHVGGEAEGRLLQRGRGALLKDPDGVVATGRGQRPSEVAPAGGQRRGSALLPPEPKGNRGERGRAATHHATS